jgi:hypothetical protein
MQPTEKARSFRQLDRRPQAALQQESFHRWTFPDGAVWAEFYRVDGDYLIRFPSLGDFAVSTDGLDVTCWPMPGTTEATIQHLYVNQVEPMAQSRAGRLMFHASAVAIDDFCVAFVGNSGRGKSTLAASFAAAGNPFLTDDGLSVEISGDRCIVTPTHPFVRLWDDSQAAIVRDSQQPDRSVQYTRKARFHANHSLPFCDQPRNLRRVFFLGDTEPEHPMITALSPVDTLLELVRHSFLLDIDEKHALAGHFTELAHLVQLPLFYRLDYPRQFELLSTVRNLVVSHARESVAKKYANA